MEINPLLSNQQNPIRNFLDPKIVEAIIHDQKVRRSITQKSHLLFFSVYFNEYIRYPMADFQLEMLALTQEERYRLLVILAFRGSAKSTYFSLSYVLWEILGIHKKKFIVLIAQTQQQAKLYLTNIRRELERNPLLARDLGPFEDHVDEWSLSSIVIPGYGARITAISMEQGIRGLRHGAHRPDVIICDDLEDLTSVRSHESRVRVREWLMGDVIPAGDLDTKVVLVGNMLHEESLLSRFKKEINTGERDGVARMYPILNDTGVVAWPGKFPTTSALDLLRRTVDEAAWSREYLLKIIPDGAQVIQKEWLHFYDVITHGRHQYCQLIIATDLAISLLTTADYTAFVSILLCSDHKGDWCAYILPDVVNARMTFPETIARLKAYASSVMPGMTPLVLVEDVGYQRSVAQQLTELGVHAEAFGVRGIEKGARLALTSAAIKQGRFLFPKTGAEAVTRQLVGFGRESHDDCADAFSLGARYILDNPPRSMEVIRIF